MSFVSDNKFILLRAASCVGTIALSAYLSYTSLVANAKDCEKIYEVEETRTSNGASIGYMVLSSNLSDIFNTDTKESDVVVLAEEQSDISIDDNTDVVSIGISFYVASENPYSNVVEPKDCISSVTFKSGSKKIITDDIYVNVKTLMYIYNNEYTYPSWDYKKRINDIEMLWEFLVEQQGVNRNIAAAIIGSICFEGKVGMEQGSYSVFKNINEAEIKLSADANDTGYGLVQWTYPKRRKFLLSYYKHINDNYDYDWETVCVLAECCTLYSELLDYKLFDDIYSEVDLMHACGLVGDVYENYSGSSKDWKIVDGQYKLTSDNCSGFDRYKYALNILRYFE